jgi:hypothetical protein
MTYRLSWDGPHGWPRQPGAYVRPSADENGRWPWTATNREGRTSAGHEATEHEARLAAEAWVLGPSEVSS